MKKPPRTAQPLPRYVKRVWLQASGTWAYYFSPPTWAMRPAADDPRGPCPVKREPLGIDYREAVARAETLLLKQFDSWRTMGLVDLTPDRAQVGTLDWLFAEYRQSDKFKVLRPRVQALHEYGFEIVGSYRLKDGRRLGAIMLAAIDTEVVDPLYEKLLRVPVTDKGAPALDDKGQPVMRERRTMINHAMKSCRRAWNVVWRLHKKTVPFVNPFSRMGLRSSDGVVPEANYAELVTAVRALDAAKMPMLAASLMVTWEWLQREEHIFTAFKLDHYRPKDRPDEVLIVHPKTGASVWIPLFDIVDGKRVALFPELMTRMDALKRDRIGSGLFFLRDWIDRIKKVPLPWIVGTSHVSLIGRKLKKVILEAGVRPELTFTSFRHGGFTELGNADLTDAQIRALSRQKSSEVVKRYVKGTQKQIVDGTNKRRAIRPAPVAETSRQLSFDDVMGRKR